MVITHMGTIYPEMGRRCDPKIILKEMGHAKAAIKARRPLDLGDGLVLDCGLCGYCCRLIIKRNQQDLYDIEIGKSHDLKYTIKDQRRNIKPQDLPEAIIRLTEGKISS